MTVTELQIIISKKKQEAMRVAHLHLETNNFFGYADAKEYAECEQIINEILKEQNQQQ